MSEHHVRIAKITCGAAYSGIQNEITTAAETGGGTML